MDEQQAAGAAAEAAAVAVAAAAVSADLADEAAQAAAVAQEGAQDAERAEEGAQVAAEAAVTAAVAAEPPAVPAEPPAVPAEPAPAAEAAESAPQEPSERERQLADENATLRARVAELESDQPEVIDVGTGRPGDAQRTRGRREPERPADGTGSADDTPGGEDGGASKAKSREAAHGSRFRSRRRQ